MRKHHPFAVSEGFEVGYGHNRVEGWYVYLYARNRVAPKPKEMIVAYADTNEACFAIYELLCAVPHEPPYTENDPRRQ